MMAGRLPAASIFALFLLLQISHVIELTEACSIGCPEGEKPCACPDPNYIEPTPDPVTGFVMKTSCEGFISYCSKGGECKPEENGCPAGK